MTKRSTLLYWIDDFDLDASPINDPVKLNENIDDKFLETFFSTLIYDPGKDLVKKVLMNV